MEEKWLLRRILEAGALELKDIAGGELPFRYSSENYGPGYLNLNGLLTSDKRLRCDMVAELAYKVICEYPAVDIVAGIDTEGILPASYLSDCLERKLHRPIHFIRVRKEEKGHGLKERIVRLRENPAIKSGSECLVFDELINFAKNICSAVWALREAGLNANRTACVLHYDNPAGNRALDMAWAGEPICLFTMNELLDEAERKGMNKNAILDFRVFLKDPDAWNKKYKKIKPEP